MNTFNWPPTVGTVILMTAFIALVCFCLPTATHGATVSESNAINAEQAWKIVKTDLLKDQALKDQALKDKAAYISIELLKADDTIKSWEKVYTVPATFQRCWLIFLDDQYGANWQHKCRYIFVDADSGKYVVVESLTPPDSMEGMKQIFPKQ